MGRWCFKLFCCFNRLGSVNSQSLLFKKQLFTDSSCVMWGCDTVAFCSGVCENFIVIPSLEAEEDLTLFNIKHSQTKGHMKGNRERWTFSKGLHRLGLSKHQHGPYMSTGPQIHRFIPNFLFATLLSQGQHQLLVLQFSGNAALPLRGFKMNCQQALCHRDRWLLLQPMLGGKINFKPVFFL